MQDESFHGHPCGHSGERGYGRNGHEHEHGHGHEHGRHEHGPERSGAPGTEFLHLELSSMLRATAQSLAQDVIGELLREAVKQRVSERLGHHIDALAEEAAERLSRDFETNLAIESLITARKEQRSEGGAAAAQASPTKRRARR